MRRARTIWPELALIGFTALVGALGFLGLYLDPGREVEVHHHLHVLTTFGWMGLLACQLRLIARQAGASHRKLGLAVIPVGALLAASAAQLTVHSAQRAIETGEPDFLLVPNIVGSLWLMASLVLGFAVRKRRLLHGAFMTSILTLFLGPALFFALIAWAPFPPGTPFGEKLALTGMIGQGALLLITIAMVARNWRNGWPYALAFATFPLAEAIKAAVAEAGQTETLTAAVAWPNEAATLLVVFLVVATTLAALVIPRPRARLAVSA